MKIALIITCLEVGGAENQVVSLADGLDACGHEVLVVSLTGDAEVMPASPRVRVEHLQITKTPQSLLRAYWRACRLIHSFAPDVVHSHMVHANLFSRLLRLNAPVPRLICTVHSTNEGGALRMWLYRMTDWLAHATTLVSREAAKRYVDCAAVDRRKALVVHNGIDCRRFRFDPVQRAQARAALGVAPATRVLLAAGRICEVKDYPNLLRAFACVAAQHPDCELWVAGVGPEQAQVQALACALSLGGRVRFLGLRRDMHRVMSAADLFVLSSSVEGFPLVVGEAMACERVVVSTDAGGVQEWLGQCGYIVPVHDTAALAGAMLQALGLEDEARRLQGRCGRERVLARYSLDAVVRQWEGIYKAGDHEGRQDASL